jgi:very-short-patch-repair endonuclease
MNDTNLERYGNIWRSSTDEWKTSIKTHFIEKYGVENPFQNDDIKEKIKLVNLERYGVMNVSSSEEIKNKKIETYLENYGVSHFSQKHLSKEALDILDNKENLLNYCLYTPMPHKSLGICKSTLHKYLKKYKIKDEFIKKHVSLMEIQISNFISSLGFNIITNTREIISPYEIDIYVPEVRLAIECNGVYWHSELNGKNKNYHLNKTKICNNMGISLMHILDYEYINHTEIVLNEILYKLKRTYIKTCAEDLRICIIDKHDEELFLNSNHIQQYEKSTVCLGVKDENKLLAVMSFKQIKSRHKSEWILLRYACVGECVNGMNELFKAFIENYNPKSVIVYPDIRWHTDNRYELMGFTYLKDSPPNYYYTKDYKILESKTKYKKNKQKKILNFFDSNLTEWENMQANGFDRIWDCGNKVYVWRKDEH